MKALVCCHTSRNLVVRSTVHHSKSSKAILAYLLYDQNVRSLQLSTMIVRLHVYTIQISIMLENASAIGLV